MLIYYSKSDYSSLQLKKVKKQNENVLKNDKNIDKKIEIKHESKKYKGVYIHYATF